MPKGEDSFAKLQNRLAETLRALPAIVGEEAVNFSLNSFTQNAWSGFSQDVWAKRKNPTKWGKRDETDRALLVKTGKLRRSIRVTRILQDRVFIGAGGPDVPYARVHNEGFRGKITQQVGEHLRRNKKGGKTRVSSFTRTINQNIPQRQFIGGQKDSPYLKARIRRVCIAEIRNAIKSL